MSNHNTQLDHPSFYASKPKIQLRDYQQTAKNFVLTQPYCALHLPMAFGKTLTVLSSLQDAPLNGHVLVIAPINIARIVWINEIEEWNFKMRHKSLILDDNGKPFRDKYKSKTHTTIENGEKKKTVVRTKIASAMSQRYSRYEEVLLDPPTMYFINNELVEDLVEWMIQNSTYWPFTTIVIDEAQSFKNPTSVRFESLTKIRPDVHRLIELSGTPIPNGYLDLWSQIYLLDQGLSLGPNITWYKNTFFQVTKQRNNAPIAWEPLPMAVETIKARTKHLVMSAENNQLVLPPIVPNELKIRLDEDLMNQYQNFRQSFVLDFAEKLDEDGIIGELVQQIRDDSTLTTQERQAQISAMLQHAVIESAGVLRGRCLQFASGQVYKTDADGNRIDGYDIIHDEKIIAMSEIVKSADSNIIIAYRFKSELDRLLKEMPALIDRPVVKFNGTREMEAAWNNREIPVMVTHPASAGHGMNFQRGGHNTAWWTLPDSSEHFEQLNGRQARPGQRASQVFIHRLRAVGTEDDKQMPRLEGKIEVQQDFLDSYKIDVLKATSDFAGSIMRQFAETS